MKRLINQLKVLIEKENNINRNMPNSLICEKYQLNRFIKTILFTEIWQNDEKNKGY